MIQFLEGNLLDSKAEALVNTVNTVGIMGKGIALQFKNLFPQNFKIYTQTCKDNKFHIGDLLVTHEETLITGKKTIINFPTKTDWRKPSEYSYISKGLEALVKTIQEKNIKSIAIPPLGAGNGGLEWNKVRPLIEDYLSNIDCDVFVYQPNFEVKEVLKKERVKLTPARAMLLAVLYDLVRHGELVSEFSSEKIAYFLQRFGAKEIFKLEFTPNFYGPYSGKFKHVLYYLNVSYITGYSSKDRKPFEELGLMMDTEADTLKYLESIKGENYLEIVNKTKTFLQGFYSSFGLELLSTVDYIAQNKNTNDIDAVIKELATWSSRKKTMFSNSRFVALAMERLEKNELLPYSTINCKR
jgi:O-acetyl-ADP-ribose deacetylase (regulator of RNase III)